MRIMNDKVQGVQLQLFIKCDRRNRRKIETVPAQIQKLRPAQRSRLVREGQKRD
jgi:hypothetical protein